MNYNQLNVKKRFILLINQLISISFSEVVNYQAFPLKIKA
jgi:hypothetical protein